MHRGHDDLLALPNAYERHLQDVRGMQREPPRVCRCTSDAGHVRRLQYPSRWALALLDARRSEAKMNCSCRYLGDGEVSTCEPCRLTARVRALEVLAEELRSVLGRVLPLPTESELQRRRSAVLARAGQVLR
jgi:hypothetical protein